MPPIPPSCSGEIRSIGLAKVSSSPKRRFPIGGCVSVVFDRRGQRDTRIHREIPDGPSEAESVNQMKGDSHVVWIDRNNFVAHLRMVRITVRES